jgi:hypothetical protein
MRSYMKRILLGALAAILSVSVMAATLTPVQSLNPVGSINGQVIASTGPTTAPSWATLSLATSNLAPIAANTVLANGTAVSARPVAFSMPSCSTTSFALIWTSGTGFTCNTAINAATLGGATFAAPGAIGSTTAASGAFTSLSASGSVSGSGFSNYLASPPSIGGTSPNSAQFTTVNMTGTITPSQTAGIVGTTTNNNANAGSVGEYIQSNVTGVAITSSTNSNITSISLTAGDWDVTGLMQTAPAGTTTTSAVSVGVSTTSAAFNTINVGLGNSKANQAPLAAGVYTSEIAPTTRISVASTTTVYLVGFVSYSVSTLTVSGQIRARRVR